MDNLLIITSSHDIAVAETVAARLEQYRVVFFDPTLVDPIAASALRNAEFVAWNACPDYPALVAAAHADAHAFEAALDAELRELLPDVSLAGWQHLNLFYFFLGHRWYDGLWKDVLGKLRGHKPHVFLCDNPSTYYWPSFVPALLLLQLLRTMEIPFSAVKYGARPEEADVVINFGEAGAGPYDVLSHLPTCFYDAAHFSAELQASGKTNLHIEPKYWGVPFEATAKTNLMRLHHQQALSGGAPPLSALAERLEARLDALLAPYLATPEYRARQARQLSTLYQCQVVDLHALERHFHTHKPGKLLLSDHDAGFHGPLLSFAARHRIPVLMVPHAKTSEDIEFDYGDVTMLTHPMQGSPLFNSRRRRLRHQTLPYVENFGASSAPPGPLKTVGLLLNGISLNGIMCTEFSLYLAGIVRIAAWCAEHGVTLRIRCRQAQSLIEIIERACGADADAMRACLVGSLSQFAQSVDLCLMYDAPTNADIEFLRTAVPILNPIPAPLSKAEAATADSRIVPRASVEATLAQLDDFRDDANNLHIFAMAQFADYVSLFKQTCALRRLL